MSTHPSEPIAAAASICSADALDPIMPPPVGRMAARRAREAAWAEEAPLWQAWREKRGGKLPVKWAVSAQMPRITPGFPNSMTHQSWPGTRLRRDSHPSIHCIAWWWAVVGGWVGEGGV